MSDSAICARVCALSLTRKYTTRNFDSAAQGIGGFTLYRGDSALPENRPHAQFINVEWRGNSAGSGPAVGLVGGVVDASFDPCVMRSNVAFLVSDALDLRGLFCR